METPPTPTPNTLSTPDTLTFEATQFEGWDSVRLANGEAELVVTVAVGPRIIRYGFRDGPNAFHVLPDQRGPDGRGQTGGDVWQPYGGHRLWTAPEVSPRSYFPDTGPYGEPQWDGSTLTLQSPTEHTTGIAKTLRVSLAPAGSAARVDHVLTNHNVWPVPVAPWALSIVANGGRVVLPQEPFVSHDDDLVPARPLILWKFTDMADPRWRWGKKYVTLRQDDGLEFAQKIGLYNAQGWGAHLTDTQAFVVLIRPAPGGPEVLTDMGSNFETFTKGPFQELETLGLLSTLAPGESVTHTEHWLLAKTGHIEDTDDALDAALLPAVAEARAQAERF